MRPGRRQHLSGERLLDYVRKKFKEMGKMTTANAITYYDDDYKLPKASKGKSEKKREIIDCINILFEAGEVNPENGIWVYIE